MNSGSLHAWCYICHQAQWSPGCIPYNFLAYLKRLDLLFFCQLWSHFSHFPYTNLFTLNSLALKICPHTPTHTHTHTLFTLVNLKSNYPIKMELSFLKWKLPGWTSHESTRDLQASIRRKKLWPLPGKVLWPWKNLDHLYYIFDTTMLIKSKI